MTLSEGITQNNPNHEENTDSPIKVNSTYRTTD